MSTSDRQTTGACYTFGYQGSTPAKLLDLCRRLAITHVVDCRARPMSRIPGFGGNQLKALFADGWESPRCDFPPPVGLAAPVYVQRGNVLGGVSASMEMPEGGPPPVDPVALEELRSEVVAGARLLLICQEHAPGDCHRHMTIALPLARMARDRPEWWPAGVEIRHVFEGTLVDPLELQRAIDDPDPEAEYECEELEEEYTAASDTNPAFRPFEDAPPACDCRAPGPGNGNSRCRAPMRAVCQCECHAAPAAEAMP